MKKIRFLPAILAVSTVFALPTKAMHPFNHEDERSHGCERSCKRSRVSPSDNENTGNAQSSHITDADKWLLQSVVRDDYESYILRTPGELSLDMMDDDVILPGLRVWAINGHREGKWILPPNILEFLKRQVVAANH